MKALVYLLGARALDIAQERDDGRPQREQAPGPLATTDETAAAWRRWREQATPVPAWTERLREPLSGMMANRPATD
jgi:hypothetical protein